MPFLAFNLEATPREMPVKIRVFPEQGLIKVRVERQPATTLILTMDAEQAVLLADLLRKEARAASPFVPDRRPRLAQNRS